MAFGQVVRRADLLLRGAQAQQPQFVGKRALRKAQPARGFGLGAAPKADYLLDAAGRIEGIELGALQVFEQAERGRSPVVTVGQDGRHPGELGKPAGAQTALPPQ